MSMGSSAIGEKAVAAQQNAAPAATKSPPGKRTTVAIADQVQQPEAR